MNEEELTAGTLAVGEAHPAAHDAFKYVRKYISNPKRLCFMRESLASCALSGNRVAEVCFETLERILNGQPISDRYLLGLAWFLKEMEKMEIKDVIRHGTND